MAYKRDDTQEKEFQEIVVNIDRVARVVKGGRRFRFKALVVAGDGKNRIGVGVSKGQDVQSAIAKATDVAKKNMITFELNNETIPHDALAKVAGAKILLKPASPGTGLIAGGAVRTILSVTGVKNVLSKSLGSSNKVNTAYATVEALQQLVAAPNWINSPHKAKSAIKADKKPVVAESKESKQ